MEEQTSGQTQVFDRVAYAKEIEGRILAQFGNDLVALLKYDQLNSQIADTDIRNGARLMQDFKSACEAAVMLFARAEKEYNSSKAYSESEHSKAALERADFWLSRKQTFEGKPLKDSGSLRDTYADMDVIYLRAREAEFAYKAFMVFLKGKIDSYSEGFYAVKEAFKAASQTPFARSGHDGIPSGGDGPGFERR